MRLTIEARLPVDLLMSMASYAIYAGEPFDWFFGRPPEGFSELRAKGLGALVNDINMTIAEDGLFKTLVVLAATAPVQESGEFVDWLRDLPMSRWNELYEPLAELVRQEVASLRRRGGHLSRWEKTWERRSQQAGRMWQDDPPKMVSFMCDTMERWRELFFAGREDVLRYRLEKEARTKSDLVRSAGPEAAVSAAVPGRSELLSLLNVEGQGELVLVPSNFVWPLVFHSRLGDTQYVIYPSGEAQAMSEGYEALKDASAVFKALGDETRLRILSLIARKQRYLQEIADALGTSPPNILHHLAVLSATGLVETSELDGNRVYAIRTDQIDGLRALLGRVLGL